jgi:hypothetical protein
LCDLRHFNVMGLCVHSFVDTHSVRELAGMPIRTVMVPVSDVRQAAASLRRNSMNMAPTLPSAMRRAPDAPAEPESVVIAVTAALVDEPADSDATYVLLSDKVQPYFNRQLAMPVALPRARLPARDPDIEEQRLPTPPTGEQKVRRRRKTMLGEAADEAKRSSPQKIRLSCNALSTTVADVALDAVQGRQRRGNEAEEVARATMERFRQRSLYASLVVVRRARDSVSRPGTTDARRNTLAPERNKRSFFSGPLRDQMTSIRIEGDGGEDVFEDSGSLPAVTTGSTPRSVGIGAVATTAADRLSAVLERRQLLPPEVPQGSSVSSARIVSDRADPVLPRYVAPTTRLATLHQQRRRARQLEMDITPAEYIAPARIGKFRPPAESTDGGRDVVAAVVDEAMHRRHRGLAGR